MAQNMETLQTCANIGGMVAHGTQKLVVKVGAMLKVIPYFFLEVKTMVYKSCSTRIVCEWNLT